MAELRERFTERATLIVLSARNIAKTKGSRELTTGHLLLAMLREGTGHAYRVLAKLAERTSRPLSTWYPALNIYLPYVAKRLKNSEIVFSRGVIAVFSRADDERKALEHTLIDSGHLLLALLFPPSEVEDKMAEDFLSRMGVSAEEITEEIAAQRSEQEQ